MKLDPIQSTANTSGPVLLNELSGVYQNTPDSSYKTLNWLLFPKVKLSAAEELSANVEIKPSSENMLEAILSRGDTVLSTKLLNGKFENNYFTLKTQHRFHTTLLLFNTYQPSKSRFTKTNAGGLTFDTQSIGCALLVVVPIFCTGDKLQGVTFSESK